MDNFKKTVSGLEASLKTLQGLADNIIPKEKINTIINESPCEASIGGSGVMVTLLFQNQEGAQKYFDLLKKQ